MTAGRVVLLHLTILLITQSAAAQFGPCAVFGTESGTLKLAGRVSNSKDQSEIPSAMVALEGRSTRQRAFTDHNGYFSFTCLPSGSYTVVVSKDGYQTVQTNFSLLTASRPDVVIRLDPLIETVTRTRKRKISLRESLIPGDAREAFDLGVRKLHKKKAAKRSVESFRKALELYPNYDEAFVQLGIAYIRLDRLDDAEQTLLRAVKSYAKNARAFAFLGKLYIQQQRTEDALLALREAIKVDDQLWLAHLDLGRLLSKQGEAEQAYEHASIAHGLAADVPDTHLLYYNACINKKDYRAALDEIDEFVKLFPDNPVTGEMKKMRKGIAREVSEGSP